MTDRIVLITGCSSGIGEATAERLARSKFAVEAFSDALRWEVAGFGVQVILVEPGLITTNFDNAAVDSIDAEGGPYGEFNANVAKATKEVYSGPMRRLGGGPEVVAKTIEKALDARRTKIRYTVTPSASLSIASRKLMGARGWDAAMRSQYAQPKASAQVSGEG